MKLGCNPSWATWCLWRGSKSERNSYKMAMGSSLEVCMTRTPLSLGCRWACRSTSTSEGETTCLPWVRLIPKWEQRPEAALWLISLPKWSMTRAKFSRPISRSWLNKWRHCRCKHTNWIELSQRIPTRLQTYILIQVTLFIQKKVTITVRAIWWSFKILTVLRIWKLRNTNPSMLRNWLFQTFIQEALTPKLNQTEAHWTIQIHTFLWCDLENHSNVMCHNGTLE